MSYSKRSSRSSRNRISRIQRRKADYIRRGIKRMVNDMALIKLRFKQAFLRGLAEASGKRFMPTILILKLEDYQGLSYGQWVWPSVDHYLRDQKEQVFKP